MRLLVARGTSPRLIDEPASLVVRIVQLREGVGDLLAGHEEFEPIGQPRITRSAASKRRDLYRMPEDKGRLDQPVLHELLEKLRDQPAPSEARLGLDVVLLDQALECPDVRAGQVFIYNLADRFHHLDALKGSGDLDFLPLV